MKRAVIAVATAAAALALAADGTAHGLPSRETVAVAAAEPITNVPGKPLVSLVVGYPPRGSSASHRHAGSAPSHAYVLSVRSGARSMPSLLESTGPGRGHSSTPAQTSQ